MNKVILFTILSFIIALSSLNAQEDFEIKLDENKEGKTVIEFLSPKKICVDIQGNIYLQDKYGKYLKSISTDGFVRTISINESVNFEKEVGELGHFIKIPKGIATDLLGNLYVIGYSKDYILKIDPMGLTNKIGKDFTRINKKIELLSSKYMIDHFKIPRSITFDTIGNIYIANKSEHIIQKINVEGIISTVAGTGSAGYLDSTGENALFAYPTGITADLKGNLFVADTWNHRIRKIDANGRVSTFSGCGVQGFSDGPSNFAKFSLPVGVAVDGHGYVFVADYGNKLMRRINPYGSVTTFPGVKTQVFTSEIVPEDTSLVKQFKPRYLQLNDLTSQLGKSKEEQFKYIELTATPDFQSELIVSNTTLNPKVVPDKKQEEIPIISKEEEPERLKREEKERVKKAEEDEQRLRLAQETAEKARIEVEKIKKAEEIAILENERSNKVEEESKKKEMDEKLLPDSEENVKTENKKSEKNDSIQIASVQNKPKEEELKKETDAKTIFETEWIKIEEAEKARLEAEHSKKEEVKPKESIEPIKKEELIVLKDTTTKPEVFIETSKKEEPIVLKDTSTKPEIFIELSKKEETIVLKETTLEPNLFSEQDNSSFGSNMLFNKLEQSDEEGDFINSFSTFIDSIQSTFYKKTDLDFYISNVYGAKIVHQTIPSTELADFFKTKLKGISFINGWYLLEVIPIKEGQKYRKMIFIK